jgi:hypothetical protein
MERRRKPRVALNSQLIATVFGGYFMKKKSKYNKKVIHHPGILFRNHTYWRDRSKLYAYKGVRGYLQYLFHAEVPLLLTAPGLMELRDLLKAATKPKVSRWRKFKCKRDIHDYPDAWANQQAPMHFYDYTCRHCGKTFQI